MAICQSQTVDKVLGFQDRPSNGASEAALLYEATKENQQKYLASLLLKRNASKRENTLEWITQKRMSDRCAGLRENSPRPCGLIYLNALVSREWHYLEGSAGSGVDLLEEVCPWRWALRF